MVAVMTDQATKPIPRAELDAARRRLCRRLAAVIVRTMAETDTSFTTIAYRIEQPEKVVRKWVAKLIDGKCGKMALREVSDIMLAMGCELEFSLHPREEASAESSPLDRTDQRTK